MRPRPVQQYCGCGAPASYGVGADFRRRIEPRWYCLQCYRRLSGVTDAGAAVPAVEKLGGKAAYVPSCQIPLLLPRATADSGDG